MFNRPSLKQINDRIKNGFIQKTGKRFVLANSPLEIMAKVISGPFHLLHGHFQYLEKQCNPLTATGDNLVNWAKVFKIYRKEASYSVGNITILGTDGTTILEEKELQDENGIFVITTEEKTIELGVATVSVRAKEPGSSNKIESGSELSFIETIVGIDSVVADENGILGGTDLESLDSLKSRLLLRIQNPPHGGNDADYINWALSIAGVTRAWVIANYLVDNRVAVIVVNDDDAITPSAQVIANVQSLVDENSPNTAEPVVFAPTLKPISFEIDVTPNTVAVQNAVESELKSLIKNNTEPGGTLLLSKINEAISIASGEEDHTLVSPSADVTSTAIELITFGDITWQ